MPAIYLRAESPVNRHSSGRPSTMLGLALGIALSVVLADPVPALAQSECSAAGLSRFGSNEQRLAVRVADGDGWEYYLPQKSGDPAHRLSAARLKVDSRRRLCMAWEAPSALTRQVVYVSTRFADDQALSLFRRGVFFSGDLRDGARRGTAVELAGDFQQYHLDRSVITHSSLHADLDGWHDSNASYGLVSGAAGYSDLPSGSERLLTLLPLRPLKSWVWFTSRQPVDTLRVVIAYSGEVGDDGVYPYEYAFRIE